MAIHPQTAIGQVDLTIADLDRSLAFYTDTLGFRILHQHARSAALSANGEQPLVFLTEAAGAQPQPAGTTGLYHFAILVPSRADLGRSLRRLHETGYSLSGASDHYVSEALYLDDPDGNGIEIYRDRPKTEWPARDGSPQMGNAQLDAQGILEAAERDGRAWDGLAPETRIGHVHLHVGDLAAAEAFYVGVLGFEVMQRLEGQALFVSAGGYHHHIGLNTWAGVGAPAPLPGSAGLREYAIELPDVAALEAVIAQLGRAGVLSERRVAGAALRDPWGNGIVLHTVPVDTAEESASGLKNSQAERSQSR